MPVLGLNGRQRDVQSTCASNSLHSTGSCHQMITDVPMNHLCGVPHVCMLFNICAGPQSGQDLIITLFALEVSLRSTACCSL
eukprot:808380-Amphidinium_carterae.1